MHMSSHVPRGILVELCKYVGNYRFSIRIRSWLAIYWCNGDALSDLVRGFELAEMLELVWDPSFGLWCPVLPL